MEIREIVEPALQQIGDNWNADELENSKLDFKQVPPPGSDRNAPTKFLRDLAESVVCFANSEGGVLVIGVADKAPDRATALPGINPDKWSLTGLVSNIYSRTSPSITVQSQAFQVDGQTVYALGVNQGSDVYSTTEGVYKFRLHDRCMPLEGEQLRGLRTVRQGLDWSSLPADAEWSDLSRAALERGANLFARIGRDEIARMALTDVPAFGRSTHLATPDGRPSRAAVLLYGSPETLDRIPEWGVNLQTRNSPGSDGRILMRRSDTTLPLVLLIDRLIDTISTLARTHIIRLGAEQVELVDYPEDALREIFSNAFAHRDWEAAGLVEVIHSPDELVVTSPGGLLPTLRPDRLIHDAAFPRNAMLANHMAELRIAEMSGLGFDRIFREIAKLGKEPPVLEDGPRFRVILPGGAGDEAFARFLRSHIPANLWEDVDVLMVLTALRHTRSVNASGLSPRLQRNPSDVQRVMSRLGNEGLVHPTRGTARRTFPNYTLTPESVAAMRTAITYRTSTVDHDDQKLIRHLRKHGRINNEDVRAYLDCDMETARNRLTRLRRRGVIDFAPDSKRRGPFVSYVLAPEGRERPTQKPTPPGPDDEQPSLF